MFYKACPKCRGDVLSKMNADDALQCLQCGRELTAEESAALVESRLPSRKIAA